MISHAHEGVEELRSTVSCELLNDTLIVFVFVGLYCIQDGMDSVHWTIC